MIVNFGATSSTGADCPAQGDWGSWCDCMWPKSVDPTTNGKCKSFMPGAPWTVVGATLRGIPHASGIGLPAGLLDGGGTGGGDGTPPPSSAGLPKVMLAGAGVLAAGGLAYLFLRRRRA